MKLEKNINTVDYWDMRFGTGDWAEKGGFTQTRLFAEAQLPFLRIPSDFNGSICDFGCGAGDAFPVYHRAWPQAKLMGIDFSAAAIRLCAERSGHVAEFACGDISAVPEVDIVICSNVLEHLDDDSGVVGQLLKKCKTLYVIVPFEEQPLSSEHIRAYGKDSFSIFVPERKVVFLARGWSSFGWRLYWDIYLKNMARLLLGRQLYRQRKQILFEFSGQQSR
ncbi:MAG: class I SAM-dependent methyltransferase [Burkholderiales bacterium]|nr:class I SAM-dependent methyltransferase [Burkholderiales bacterium]